MTEFDGVGEEGKVRAEEREGSDAEAGLCTSIREIETVFFIFRSPMAIETEGRQRRTYIHFVFDSGANSLFLYIFFTFPAGIFRTD